MDRGIWVDRGCRADFQVASAGGAGFNGWDNGYNVYCASDDGRRNVCPIDTRGGVQLIRKRSDSSCDYGRDWAYNNRGIWVDHGCRAEFEVGAQAPPVIVGRDGGHDRDHDGYRDHDGRRDGEFRGWGDVYMVYCASDAMQRVWCPADSRFGVRMIRQRSEADGFVTTEKDAVNLGGYLSALAPLAVVPVKMELADAANAVDTMLARIAERRRQP